MHKPLAMVLVLIATACVARAQAPPTTRPALDQLNRETQALYAQVQTGVYRVELPAPRWLNAYAMAPINKWDQKLDPEVRRQLAEAHVSIDVNPSNLLAHPEPSDETTVGQSKYVAPRPPPVDDNSDPVLGARLELD